MSHASILLICVVLIATITDIRSHRIPNWLTLSAVVFGLGSQVISSGLHGLLSGFGGLVLGMAFFMVFYLLGGTGAGDVKLMGAVGSFLGPWGVLNAFLWTALAGGVYSLGMILFHSRLKPMRMALASTATHFFYSKRVAYSKPEIAGERPKLCYGVAIAIGTIVSLFVKLV